MTLSSSTPGATIYFTGDGTAPTTASQVYNGTPLAALDGTTIRAIAVAPGYSQSAVSGGTYSIAFGMSGLRSDLVVSAKGTGPVSTAAFSTTSARALLLAFVSSSGPAAGTQSASVTGAGLDWTLIVRANSQPGTAEVWAAAATEPLSNVTVQSTPGVAGFAQLLTVEVVTGSYDYEALVGATATASASSGPPSIALAPTGSGSWFFAVGSDAATSLPRIAGASQTIVAEYADASSHADLWVQQMAVNVPDPGGSLLLNDTAPATSAHNLSAIEVRRSISFDGIGRASRPWDVLPLGGSYPGPVAATAGGPPGTAFVWKYVWANPLEPFQYYGAPILRQATGSVYICQYCPSCPCVDTYYAIAAPPAGIANESTVGARGFETVRTPQFSTNGYGGKLLLAFVTSGGPPDHPQAASVGGAGLTWSLLERSNARQGTAEVWAAYAEFPLTLVSVEATQDVPGYLQQLTVVALDGATVGTTTAASGPSGSAGAGLTSTDDGSWVFAAGTSISSLGYPQWQHWVTQLATPAGPRGTSVAMDSAQTAINSTWDDYLGASSPGTPWNMVALEVRGQLAPPVFSPPSGTPFPGGFPVSIASPTPNATIYFTTDGSTPTRSSTAYQGPIHLTGPATIKAVAFAAGATSSDVATATYTVAEPPLPGGMLASVFATAQGIGPVTTAPLSTSGAPRLLLAFVSTAGPSGAPQTATVSSAGTPLTWTLVRRANGQPGSAEAWAATPPGALANVTVRADPAHPGFQQLLTVIGFSGGAASIGTAGSASGAPELNLLPGVALVATAGGSWFFGVGSDAALGERRSTLGGQPVLAELTDAVGGSDHWVQAWAVPGGDPGSTASMGVAGPRDARWNFAGVEVRPPAGASPVFAPPPGTYVAPQTVALSSATPELAIRFTTDGSTPGSSSPLYQGPVELATTTTIRAVAQGGGGYATSEVSAGHYALCMPTACTAYSVVESACVPAHAPPTAPCDDGNPCTRDDRCSGTGQCTGGAAVSVDDGNACTADGCDPLVGVTHVPLAAGTTCSDGNACNGSEFCNGVGQCLAGTPPPVDDGDPCTADSCHSVAGVLHTPIPNCSVLPPDPALVATTINATRATDIASSTSFLYEGPNPVQYRVAPGTVDPRRVTVLRGMVADRAGAGLPGVEVSILGHPEFGVTRTRAGGLFDMAVNGGGDLTIAYKKDGFLPAQRRVEAPWRDFSWLPDLVLVPFDAISTPVALGSSAPQAARGSVVHDVHGTRQATMIFAPGTEASMRLAGGTVLPLGGQVHVRATEYTVGSSGPKAMPAALPPASAYTYAVELSVDEAVTAGATRVDFNQPVATYVENFLGFPVGTPVPAGYYDRAAGKWLASHDGVVVGLVSIASGLAMLDVDGDGLADAEATLAALGITLPERQMLASVYSGGQSLWRVPVDHFTPWDFNWAFECSGSCAAPDQSGPESPEPEDEPDEECGSIIDCQNQGLGEALPISGTPYRLHYTSQRAGSRAAGRTITVSLTGPTVPTELRQISLDITVAGQRYSRTFGPTPNLRHVFTWDGTDAYGRPVQGSVPAVVRVGFASPGVYRSASGMMQGDYSFGQAAALCRGYCPYLEARELFWQYRSWSLKVGSVSAEVPGLGGWLLSPHHSYDAVAKRLYRGDGASRGATGALSNVITTVAGGGYDTGDGGSATRASLRYPTSIAFGADGSFYVATVDWGVSGNGLVRKVDSLGRISTVAGCLSCSGPAADGVPATSVVMQPLDVAIAPDGALLIADLAGRRVWRVGQDGLLRAFAGGGAQSPGDGGPATQASLGPTSSVALAPDGSVVILEGSRLRRIDTNGFISTIAGAGTSGADGIPATDAVMPNAGNYAKASVGNDGSIYVPNIGNTKIRRIGPDGIIRTFAGTGVGGFSGDGGPALQAQLSGVNAIHASPSSDGSVLIADSYNMRVRLVTPEGLIRTLAGNGCTPGPYGGGCFAGDGGPATAAAIDMPWMAARGPDGAVYVVDTSNLRIRKITQAFPGYSGNGLVVPSASGAEVYHFDATGRHLRTTDALTGVETLAFGYDSAGRLASLTDRSANVTSIVRDANGVPTEIRAPFGQVTSLVTNGDGRLGNVSDAAGEVAQLSYAPDGLLLGLRDARGQDHAFAYDQQGRLLSDAGPARAKVLSRTEQATGYTTAMVTALGRPSTYSVAAQPNGDKLRVRTLPDGTQVTKLDRPGGTTTHALPDGTTVVETRKPDPRFLMAAPIVSGTTTTPGGRSRAATSTRTVAYASPGDPSTPLSSLTESVSVNGRAWTSTYNLATRQMSSRTPAGRATVTTFDAKGRPVRIAPPGVAATDLTYDGRGRLEVTSQAPRAQRIEYDAMGRPWRLTDPLLRQVTFEYDQAGRVWRQMLPGGRQVTFGHDAGGNLTSLAPPGRTPHGFSYWPGDAVKSYDPPAAYAGALLWPTGYTYDLDGALTSVTLPDGTSVIPAYEPLTGRLSSVTTAHGSTGVGYDPLGRASTLTSLEQTLTYAYDGFLTTSEIWSGTVTGTVGYGYDNDFRVASQGVNGASLSFGYDADGLLTSAGALAIGREVTTGRVSGSTLGTVTTSQTYTTYGEPRVTTARVGGTAVYTYTLNRSALSSRIDGKTEAIGGVTTTTAYGYDAAERLETVTVNGTLAATYGYDLNGNRTSRTTASGTEVGTPDEQDRMTSYGGASYTYRPTGSLESKTIGTATTWYDYDALGSLRAVLLPGGSRIDYVVDGQNRRVGKKVNGALVEGFLYEGKLRSVAWLDGTGQVKARFVYGTRINVPEYMVTTTGTYRILTDHLGSPRLVVDSTTGAIAQRMDYDEWGVVLADTNPGFQPFGFAGGIYDRDTGLVRFGARDYEPRSGRWTNKDRARFQGGLNLYEYAGGDPVNFQDFTGKYAIGVPTITPIPFTTVIGTSVYWAGGAGLAFGAGWLAGTWLNDNYLSQPIQNLLDKVLGPPGVDPQAGRKSDLKQVDAVTRGYPDLRDDFGEWLEDLKEHGERGTKNDRGDFTYRELEDLFRQFRRERGCGQ